jgi:hypothetical protein
VKLGDANTKFFHTRATISYKKNYVSILKSDANNEIVDHAGKAEILWNAFKEIIGKSDDPKMHFNLQDIYENTMDSRMREDLEIPFSDAQIDEVIKGLPNEKSPGSDGFNNEFIKNCWNIIRAYIKKINKGFL